ncbi:MAG: hypothetical protein M1305_04095 [Candidatus Marsarchaeota archaeon]|nr:hypothetical protein [Candidatus Marsarchaeota archaeon]
MKAISVVLKTGLMILVASACVAATPPKFPPHGRSMGVSSVMIGPVDFTGRPLEVRGVTKIACHTPLRNAPASVQVFLDGKLLGTATKNRFLFTTDFDTTKVADGEHTLKASGLDASGKEVWSASTKVIVANSSPASEKPDLHRPPIAEFIPAPKKSAVEPVRPKPEDMRPEPPVADAGGALSSMLKSERYGFSLRYPADWTSADETERMSRQVRGRWWVTLGTRPLKNSRIVVNIRRRKLYPGSNVDTFARYESYIKKWNKTTVLGCPAFSTVSGSPASKRVIHRLIVVDGDVVWMLNCTDTTGGPEERSGKLFNEIVNTMSFSPAPGSAANEEAHSAPPSQGQRGGYDTESN